MKCIFNSLSCLSFQSPEEVLFTFREYTQPLHSSLQLVLWNKILVSLQLHQFKVLTPMVLEMLVLKSIIDLSTCDLANPCFYLWCMLFFLCQFTHFIWKEVNFAPLGILVVAWQQKQGRFFRAFLFQNTQKIHALNTVVFTEGSPGNRG